VNGRRSTARLELHAVDARGLDPLARVGQPGLRHVEPGHVRERRADATPPNSGRRRNRRRAPFALPRDLVDEVAFEALAQELDRLVPERRRREFAEQTAVVLAGDAGEIAGVAVRRRRAEALRAVAIHDRLAARLRQQIQSRAQAAGPASPVANVLHAVEQERNGPGADGRRPGAHPERVGRGDRGLGAVLERTRFETGLYNSPIQV
jgi:hypothetical protein